MTLDHRGEVGGMVSNVQRVCAGKLRGDFVEGGRTYVKKRIILVR